MRSDKHKLLLNLKEQLTLEQREDKVSYYQKQYLVSEIKRENLKSLELPLVLAKQKVSFYKKNILNRTRFLFIIEKFICNVKIKSKDLTLNEKIEELYKEEIMYIRSLLNKIKE